MKLTATTQSTTLFDLLQNATTDEFKPLQLIEAKRIKNELEWCYGVEIVRWDWDIYVETIDTEASTDSRPINSNTPIFAFNTMDLRYISVYAESSTDFYISIV